MIFHIEPSLHTWNKSQLLIVYNSFYTVLYSIISEFSVKDFHIY